MSHLLSTATPGGEGCFAEVLVAGVVEGPPEVPFYMLAEPVHCGVFSDVKSTRELRRSRLHGPSDEHVSRLEVEQVTRVEVLRVPMDTVMRVQLDCNHTAKQVMLRLMRGNKLLRSFEGVYAVLPLATDGDLEPGTPRLPPQLPPQLSSALGPECSRKLTTVLEEAEGMGRSGGASNDAARQREQQQVQEPAQQRSLVVLHQRMQPVMSPPLGLGGFVRGQVRRQFENMFKELQAACRQQAEAPSTPPARACLAMADRLRSSLSLSDDSDG